MTDVKEAKQKEMQKKYMELQMVDHQMKQIQQQVEALEAQSAELDMVQAALDDFSKSKNDSELFVTVTPGIFAKAKLEKNDSVLLSVGSGVVVQKNIPDAKKVLAGQVVEMRKLQEELSGQLDKLSKHAEKVQEELKKLIE
jgi:prefoldin alpha subunit